MSPSAMLSPSLRALAVLMGSWLFLVAIAQAADSKQSTSMTALHEAFKGLSFSNVECYVPRDSLGSGQYLAPKVFTMEGGAVVPINPNARPKIITSYAEVQMTVDVVIISKDNKMLLIQRRKSSDTNFVYQEGKWALCGGFIDIIKGETAYSAAKRELKEETGLDLAALGTQGILQRVDVVTSPNRDPRGYAATIVYVARLGLNAEDIKTVKAGDDAQNAVWMDIDQKTNSLSWKGRIQDIHNIVFPREYWPTGSNSMKAAVEEATKYILSKKASLVVDAEADIAPPREGLERMVNVVTSLLEWKDGKLAFDHDNILFRLVSQGHARVLKTEQELREFHRSAMKELSYDLINEDKNVRRRQDLLEESEAALEKKLKEATGKWNYQQLTAAGAAWLLKDVIGDIVTMVLFLGKNEFAAGDSSTSSAESKLTPEQNHAISLLQNEASMVISDATIVGSDDESKSPEADLGWCTNLVQEWAQENPPKNSAPSETSTEPQPFDEQAVMTILEGLRLKVAIKVYQNVCG